MKFVMAAIAAALFLIADILPIPAACHALLPGVAVGLVFVAGMFWQEALNERARERDAR